jgi:hypothetical protein
MRRGLATVLVGAALLGSPGAEAKDLNGRLGVGGARTLGGVQGVDVIYWSGRLGLGGTLGFVFGSPDEGDSDIRLDVALGILDPIISREMAELSLGARVNLGIHNNDRGTQIAIEGPVRLQWYLTDHLSLFGEVGLVVELVPEEGRVLSSAGGVGSNGTGIIIGGTYLTGGGGFTVLF